MKTVRIVPEQDENGEVFLNVYGDNTVDRVGPLREGEECLAILEPEKPKGATAPTRRMKRVSQKQERENAAMVGGQVQPGSGSNARAKGDFLVRGKYRGESKFTYAKQYLVSLDILEKITRECKKGEMPVLCVRFLDKATNRNRGDFVMLHQSDFEEMLKNASANNR